MYTREEASAIRRKFWTSFGQYMRPVKGGEGETVNWLNYKTGIKHIYFRMDAGTNSAMIAIELQHPDDLTRQYYFGQFKQWKNTLEATTGESWDWAETIRDEDGSVVSRIGKELEKVNVFREEDWPAIISFLKPRIIALDAFWLQAKDFIGQ